jgi:metal-responsive CopG/Arc/MetJ family transcriptional regulator
MEMFGVSMDKETKQVLEAMAKEMRVSRSAALRLAVRFAAKHHGAFRAYARRFVKKKRKHCEASRAREGAR